MRPALVERAFVGRRRSVLFHGHGLPFLRGLRGLLRHRGRGFRGFRGRWVGGGFGLQDGIRDLLGQRRFGRSVGLGR